MKGIPVILILVVLLQVCFLQWCGCQQDFEAQFILIISQRCQQDFEAQFLGPHNDARSQVGVGPLQWDNTVASYAQNYANQRIADCALRHSGGSYGENIFWGSGKEFSPGDAVTSWVNEKQYYNHASNSCAQGQQCGHYTQVVWRNSVKLGCARVKCNSGAIFITCNYDPPGNYVGQTPY